MKIQLINNYKYKGKWNPYFHLYLGADYAGRYILLGILNLFLFISY
jgi:hypothetical protein